MTPLVLIAMMMAGCDARSAIQLAPDGSASTEAPIQKASGPLSFCSGDATMILGGVSRPLEEVTVERTVASSANLTLGSWVSSATVFKLTTADTIYRIWLHREGDSAAKQCTQMDLGVLPPGWSVVVQVNPCGHDSYCPTTRMYVARALEGYFHVATAPDDTVQRLTLCLRVAKDVIDTLEVWVPDVEHRPWS